MSTLKLKATRTEEGCTLTMRTLDLQSDAHRAGTDLAALLVGIQLPNLDIVLSQAIVVLDADRHLRNQTMTNTARIIISEFLTENSISH